jgi:hypothetical protein
MLPKVLALPQGAGATQVVDIPQGVDAPQDTDAPRGADASPRGADGSLLQAFF